MADSKKHSEWFSENFLGKNKEGGPGSGRRPGGGKGKSAPKMSFDDAMKHINDFEKTGKGFFDRGSNDSLHIFSRGGSWSNARDIVSKLGHHGAKADIQPDPQSGHIKVTIPGFYKGK